MQRLQQLRLVFVQQPLDLLKLAAALLERPCVSARERCTKALDQVGCGRGMRIHRHPCIAWLPGP
jgi:hypothetical protein